MALYSRLLRIFILGLAFIPPSVAYAAIDKMAIPNDQGISFFWWPHIKPPAGWEQDKSYSYRYGFYALVPIGQSFGKAETIIYAKANYKPRDPDIKSLTAFIERDKKEFIDNEPTLQITEGPALQTADQKTFISYSFSPQKGGDWAVASYGEEGDFYLTFVISSHSKEGLEQAIPLYTSILAGYKEDPSTP